ncbi:MAG: penicillin acylase family protein, partial [Longimicrobiales bacterium]
SSGWIRYTGAGAFDVSAPGDNPDSAAFPRYMSPLTDGSRVRAVRAVQAMRTARAARRRLADDAAWTLEEWAAAAFDAYVPTAEEAIPLLIAEWEQVGGTDPRRARLVDEAMDQLRAWDHVAEADSEAATLFVLWQERLRSGGYEGDYAQFRAMEDVVAALERDWGSSTVAWGEINRLQRVRSNEGVVFSDQRESLPVPGAPIWGGSIFTFNAQPVEGAARRYGVSGTRWIAAAELGTDVRFRSIVPFGQSADPRSAHWADQAVLYARGELKNALFRREEIIANARRVYRAVR